MTLFKNLILKNLKVISLFELSNEQSALLMTPIEIFSLDILIILFVVIPLALTPSWFVLTESRQIRWMITGLWCAIGF